MMRRFHVEAGEVTFKQESRHLLKLSRKHIGDFGVIIGYIRRIHG
jgi:hypothetical protein